MKHRVHAAWRATTKNAAEAWPTDVAALSKLAVDALLAEPVLLLAAIGAKRNERGWTITDIAGILYADIDRRYELFALPVGDDQEHEQ